MKIRILQPVTVTVDLQPGDQLLVQRESPATAQLLSATRLNGDPLARVVGDEADADDAEYATVAAVGETTTVGKVRNRGARPA